MIFEGDVWKAIIDISKDIKRITDTLERNQVKAITDEEFDSMLARLIADRKTKPMETTDYCDVCNHKGCDNCVADGSNSYCVPSHYEPKDEPRTDCNGCKFVGAYDTEFPCAICARKTKDYYEPQTERSK